MFWSFWLTSGHLTGTCSAVYVVWDPIILTIILIYKWNIKNCITLSSFGCVEIYTGNKSSMVWIAFKIYWILHLKSVEFPFYKFSTSSSLLLFLLTCNLDSRYLCLFFSCVYWCKRQWLWVFFSFWSEFFFIEGYINYH